MRSNPRSAGDSWAQFRFSMIIRLLKTPWTAFCSFVLGFSSHPFFLDLPVYCKRLGSGIGAFFQVILGLSFYVSAVERDVFLSQAYVSIFSFLHLLILIVFVIIVFGFPFGSS